MPLSPVTPLMRVSDASGTLMLALHQAFLSLGGIGLAHSDARGDSLWRANKEGLISLVGYCALSLHARFQVRWTRAQMASAARCGGVVLPQGVRWATSSATVNACLPPAHIHTQLEAAIAVPNRPVTIHHDWPAGYCIELPDVAHSKRASRWPCQC